MRETWDIKVSIYGQPDCVTDIHCWAAVSPSVSVHHLPVIVSNQGLLYDPAGTGLRTLGLSRRDCMDIGLLTIAGFLKCYDVYMHGTGKGSMETYSSPLECNIPATIWGVYLQALHGRENLQDAEIEPLLRKIPALDLIPPELPGNHSDWWAAVLASLFTSIHTVIQLQPLDTGIIKHLKISKKLKRYVLILSLPAFLPFGCLATVGVFGYDVLTWVLSCCSAALTRCCGHSSLPPTLAVHHQCSVGLPRCCQLLLWAYRSSATCLSAAAAPGGSQRERSREERQMGK
ncbi:hypothetical protein L345_11922, partial [Ophiophagus hannah]